MSGAAGRPDLGRRLAAQLVGTAFLLATVVGSGIMGERLAAGNMAVALLANTLATGAALVALILTFGPISGAHFDQPWDYIVTVCDGANDRCPVFPRRGRRLHWSFEDPSRATGNDHERLQVFRRIRDEIAARVGRWLRERGR